MKVWRKILDWLPVYEDQHGRWRLLGLVAFVRVLWRRATERRREYPQRPHKGVLVVPFDFSGPPPGTSVDPFTTWDGR